MAEETVETKCPHCGIVQKAEKEAVGHFVPCPDCGKSFTVKVRVKASSLSVAAPPPNPISAKDTVLTSEDERRLAADNAALRQQQGGQPLEVVVVRFRPSFDDVFYTVFKVIAALVVWAAIFAGVVWFMYIGSDKSN